MKKEKKGAQGADNARTKVVSKELKLSYRLP
jgi:hypothetical protein